MNPKISIVVDAKNKAISTLTGIVSVGSKIDIEVSGISLSSVPDWGTGDDFTGPSLRFRVVDESGRDLVRFPIHKKTELSPDTWTKDTVNNKFIASNVDFNTDVLRKVFYGISFSDNLDLGIIIDSTVDSAEYAIGRMKVRQWAIASTEDPTILPDWRETLSKLSSALANIESSKTAAQQAASIAVGASTSAQTSAGSASASSIAASTSASNCESYSSQANDNRILAQSAKASAEAAKLAAEVAVTHYPKIGANENWYVWDVVNGVYVDTGYCANGGHNIFKGKTFARPSNAKGWYELIAHLIIEMGGNIQTEGITPGSSPSAITMTASDGAQKMLKIVKSNDEYTTEVV